MSGSLHLHRGGECLKGDASFGEAGQINVFPADLTMFPATVEDSHPFEGESPNRHVMALAPRFELIVISPRPVA